MVIRYDICMYTYLSATLINGVSFYFITSGYVCVSKSKSDLADAT